MSKEQGKRVYKESVDRLAQMVLQGDVTVLTGAGVSTESGLPDFRGRQGLWTGANHVHLASAEGAAGNPDLFVAFCKEALKEVAAHRPNLGHRLLAYLQHGGVVGKIITQNVDGYHQAAGARDIVELHGSIREIACRPCGARASADEFLADGGERCSCGNLRRPCIVLFGEALEPSKIAECLDVLVQTRLLLFVGTSLGVKHVAMAPAMVRRAGGRVAVINQEATAADDVADVVIRGRAGTVLADLYQAIVAQDNDAHGLPDLRDIEYEHQLDVGEVVRPGWLEWDYGPGRRAMRLAWTPELRWLKRLVLQLAAEEGELVPRRSDLENLAWFLYRRFSERHPNASTRLLSLPAGTTVDELRRRMNRLPTGPHWWEGAGGQA